MVTSYGLEVRDSIPYGGVRRILFVNTARPVLEPVFYPTAIWDKAAEA
jgi:hypothetical protein